MKIQLSATEWLEKAKTELEVATLLFNHGYFNHSISSSYYVMLYSVHSAIKTHYPDMPDPLRHKGLRNVLNEKLISDGHYPDIYFNIIEAASQSREASDYTGKRVEQKSATHLLNQAEDFLKITLKNTPQPK